ncbi:alpha-glucosidase/alpha-galactosidase [Cohnella hongkongensis]|uniref:Alpha-glucosidase/alpha-galactosidase n=1 Tax=Cohnella hongkongensis TaxID=178337 RepID=A0ABV9FJM1_9BACL
MPKITFIGAGSAVFTRNLLGDLLTYPELDGSEVCLMDIDAKRLDKVKKLAEKMVRQEKSNISIAATTDRREALNKADYVLITIQVGGLEAYELDIEIPRKYGVEQCVGDTVGPGGVFRGMRHLAVISEIYKELEELSPNALVLQYTNPMAILTGAMNRLSPIQTIGLCHSVQKTSRALAEYINIPYEEVTFWVAGINHVSWFLKFDWNRKDAYPLLFEKLNDPSIYGQDPVRFDMMKNFGYYPTESSSHGSEYYPYFRKRPDLLEKLVAKFTDGREQEFDFGRTGGYLRDCQLELKNYYTDIEKQLQENERIPVSRSLEYGVEIIHSLETNTVRRINGNVMNQGLIPNLPHNCCVEVPCLVDTTGIHPCHVGELPEQLAALIRTNVNVQQLAIEAHIRKDRDLIYQAVKMDPLTSACCSLDEIDGLVTEMFEAQKQWLPQF